MLNLSYKVDTLNGAYNRVNMITRISLVLPAAAEVPIEEIDGKIYANKKCTLTIRRTF